MENEMVKNVVETVAEKAMSKKEIVIGAALVTGTAVGVGMVGREVVKFIKKKINDKKVKAVEPAAEAEETVEETEEE